MTGSSSLKLGGGGNSGGFSVVKGVSASYEEGGGSSSLVLDGERGELIRAPPPVKITTTGKKGTVERGGGGGGGGGGVEDVKTLIALKNHSEAERRRRERINSHLAKLRSLLPGTTIKLDKASLLAEVINHVKELKSQATEASLKHTIPSDTNEIHVELVNEGTSGGSFLIKASLCCEDHPELITELKQTLETLNLKTLSAEISTLGGRVRHVFAMTSSGSSTDIEKHLLTSSLQRCLKSVLDRVSSQANLSTNGTQPGKRRRIFQFESSSSSS